MFYYGVASDFDGHRRGEIVACETELQQHVANGKLYPIDAPQRAAKVTVLKAARIFSDEATRRLAHHAPTSTRQQDRYATNREKFMDLFDYIESVGGDSREKALAKTALQEAMMWLNAHVACNNVDGE